MALGRKTGGRPKGSPNKATLKAREAIAAFVDGNAHRMVGWLDDVANGVPAVDEKGKPILGKWLVPPQPEKAFAMLQSVVEYHVPKLARTEMTGEDGGPVQITINKLA